MSAEILWKRPCDGLPDDDMTVLVVMDDGEVWTGFRDAGAWRYVSGETIPCEVLYWAQFPAPPQV